MNLPIYLDNNATTAVDPRVVEAMLPYFSTYFGNAASTSHAYGWIAEEAVQQAREQVAQLLGAQQEEIIFTSGATEAVNLAIKGCFETYKTKGRHIVTVKTEHSAVLDTCAYLEKQHQAHITYLDVNANGEINLHELEEAIRTDTILVAVMMANNETGVIQDIEAIGSICKEKNVLFFSDATQAAGKIPIDVNRQNTDLLCLSAHKFYGPKGVGALYVRRRGPRVQLSAQLHGGGHEKGRRSGTLNVSGIVGLGKAAEIAQSEMPGDQSRLLGLRQMLEEGIAQKNRVKANRAVHSMAHVSNLSFYNIDGKSVFRELNKSVAISHGSACTNIHPKPSHVLLAMGLEEALIDNTFRFSLGRNTTEADIHHTLEAIDKAIALFS